MHVKAQIINFFHHLTILRKALDNVTTGFVAIGALSEKFS